MAQLDFISLFLKQVAERGNSVAIKSSESSMTYAELFQKSRAVQVYLNEQKNHHPFVGIDCNAGMESYAYIIGVWLYGGAYVPVNSEYPAGHLAEIKAQTNLKLVLNKETKIIEESDLAKTQTIEPKIEQELAYVIFTSGTTGKPKGVPILKSNLNAFFSHYLDSNNYEFSAQDVFLQSYELSFDVSVFCFGMPLMLGANLILPLQQGIKYLNIAAAILKNNVTVCSNVPSVAMHLYSRLNEVEFSSLRYCFFSGEALYGNWALAWMKAAKNAQVYNCYGPTETTIVCTSEHLNTLDRSYFASDFPLPLGQVFKGTKMKIQDEELHFKGEQVFKGFLNQDTNTDQLFPTGDLAFRDENSRLIFKGRKDQQVQINGYRVELQSIDNCIKAQLSMRSATFVFKNSSNANVICTAVEKEWVDELLVKKILSAHLPSYSQPLYLTAIKDFPLNQNGKLDKQELKKLVRRQLGEHKIS